MRPAVLIAARRLQSDRYNVVIAAGAAALAVAAAAYAGLAIDLAGRALHDKACTFVGSETDFVVFRGTPSAADLGAPSTMVDRLPNARSQSASVQVIGVDRATFAAAASGVLFRPRRPGCSTRSDRPMPTEPCRRSSPVRCPTRR